MKILRATRDDAAGGVLRQRPPGSWACPIPAVSPWMSWPGSPRGRIRPARAHVDGADLDMSFSGLKTAVVNLAHNAQQKGEPLDRAALARTLPGPSATSWCPEL